MGHAPGRSDAEVIARAVLRRESGRTSGGIWGFVWLFLFTLIGMLGVVIFTEGDTRRYILQGAVVGSIVSLIFLVAVAVFVVQY